MNKKFLLRELKLVFRNKLLITYSVFGFLFFIGIMFLLLSNVESQSFNSFIIVSLIAYSSFWGSSLFIWDWDREYYKFFILKNSLTKIILSKIVFVTLINLFFTIITLIVFKINDYNYYFNILLFSGINGIGIVLIILLIILSKNTERIDLFDSRVFLIKQSAINILVSIILVGFIVGSYYVFKLFSFQTLIIFSIILNFLVLTVLKNKIIKLLEKQLITTNKIQ